MTGTAALTPTTPTPCRRGRSAHATHCRRPSWWARRRGRSCRRSGGGGGGGGGRGLRRRRKRNNGSSSIGGWSGAGGAATMAARGWRHRQCFRRCLGASGRSLFALARAEPDPRWRGRALLQMAMSRGSAMLSKQQTGAKRPLPSLKKERRGAKQAEERCRRQSPAGQERQSPLPASQSKQKPLSPAPIAKDTRRTQRGRRTHTQQHTHAGNPASLSPLFFSPTSSPQPLLPNLSFRQQQQCAARQPPSASRTATATRRWRPARRPRPRRAPSRRAAKRTRSRKCVLFAADVYFWESGVVAETCSARRPPCALLSLPRA